MGRRPIPLDLRGLAPGAYFVRLVAGETRETRKIVIVE
jgi:hypothetical protein